MDHGWSTHIDAYCERLGPGFWAEPVNALTNAAFLIAALVVCQIARREDRLDPPVGLLLLLMVAIGIGSFLFHTFATRWAALADTLPITLFILAYLTLTLRRGFGLGWIPSVLLGLAFLPASAAIASAAGFILGDLLGGSTGYLPALLALLVCGTLLNRKGNPAGTSLLLAALLFALSLTFRTLDGPVCSAWPLGTHFLWHLLNGLLLGHLTLAMTRMQPLSDPIAPAARR